jgi:hypothetical protein
MPSQYVWERPLDVFKLTVTVLSLILLVALAARRGTSVSTTGLSDSTRPAGAATLDGGESAAQPATASLDSTAQRSSSPVITHPADGASLNVGEVLAFEGTAAPGARLQILEGSSLLGEVVAGSDGVWRLELPDALAAGTHSLQVVVLDDAGQALAASETLTLNVQPEVTSTVTPEATQPAIGAGLRLDEPLAFEGTAAPGTTVWLYNGIMPLGETIADADGSWRLGLPVPLEPGEHRLRVVMRETTGEEVAVVSPLIGNIRTMGDPEEGEWHVELSFDLKAAGINALRVVVVDDAALVPGESKPRLVHELEFRQLTGVAEGE